MVRGLDTYLYLNVKYTLHFYSVKKFSTSLRVYRLAFKMTQEDLAKDLRVSRQAVNAIEQEKNPPSLLLAFRCAHLFDVAVEELFQFPRSLL